MCGYWSPLVDQILGKIYLPNWKIYINIKRAELYAPLSLHLYVHE